MVKKFSRGQIAQFSENILLTTLFVVFSMFLYISKQANTYEHSLSTRIEQQIKRG